MFTYLTLLISHVHSVFYAVYCTLPMPLSHLSSIYLYVLYTFSFTPLDLCILGPCWGIVRLLVRYYCTVDTALSILEAQACYTRINIC